MKIILQINITFIASHINHEDMVEKNYACNIIILVVTGVTSFAIGLAIGFAIFRGASPGML